MEQGFLKNPRISALQIPITFLQTLIVFQSPSCVWLFETPWTAAHQASLSLTQVCPSSCPLHQWCHPAISSSDALFFLCSQSLSAPGIHFSTESAVHIRWPEYWSSSFNISSPNEYSGFISLKIDSFDLLVVQGTFRSLFQHHSLKASILWHSAFLLVQLSQPYVTTGKTIALTIWTFVSRVMCLLFNKVWVCHRFPAKKQMSSDLMAALTTCSNFGAQEEEICHYALPQ